MGCGGRVSLHPGMDLMKKSAKGNGWGFVEELVLCLRSSFKYCILQMIVFLSR